MTTREHTFRELLYLGKDNIDDVFAAESESMRLAGRGGMGYLVKGSKFGWSCNCPAPEGECWHIKVAPQALVYWHIRLAHGEKSREEFEAFYAQWWPRRDPIMGRCREEGDFKGKGATEWECFFSALLDEWNARATAYGKMERAFGKDLLSAVLSVKPQEEGA